MSECDDLIQEQTYLVSRGVKPLALLSGVEDDHAEMHEAYSKEAYSKLMRFAGGTGTAKSRPTS